MSHSFEIAGLSKEAPSLLKGRVRVSSPPVTQGESCECQNAAYLRFSSPHAPSESFMALVENGLLIQLRTRVATTI